MLEEKGNLRDGGEAEVEDDAWLGYFVFFLFPALSLQRAVVVYGLMYGTMCLYELGSVLCMRV